MQASNSLKFKYSVIGPIILTGKILLLLLSFFFVVSCSPSPVFNAITNDSNNKKLSPNEFSIITYNIQTAFGKDEEKVSSLTKYLKDHNYDFVVMQEVFDEEVREQLVKNLDPENYVAQIPRIDYKAFPTNISQDAGLFLISRYPMIDLTNINFGEDVEKTNGAIHKLLQKNFSISLDFLANKSVLGSLHELNDSTKLFIFTTHLQAISSRFHKTYQLEQIYKFIVNAVYTVIKEGIVESAKNLGVLLVGDLNYDAYTEADVNTLKSFLGDPRDLHKEFNSQLEEYTLFIKWIGMYRRVDYIFSYDNIGLLKLAKVQANSINVTDVTDVGNGSISDHLALKATLIIK
jgi:endonuclease/exonuclease/phosphatase family metal-dependent hydrolase